MLEVVLVVILISILFLVALSQLLPLRGQAEQAAVIGSVGAIEASLGFEVADRVMRIGHDALPELDRANPVLMLGKPPDGYVGQRPVVDPASLEPGSWAFDSGRGVLVYRVRYPQYFRGSLLDPPRGEWQVQLVYRGESRAARDIRAVRLVPLAETDWQFDAR